MGNQYQEMSRFLDDIRSIATSLFDLQADINISSALSDIAFVNGYVRDAQPAKGEEKKTPISVKL
ncbi:hypothetical protein RRF57_006819 [Xylaria bambusicola]|uniref:Uncharacterized protein n=1 Tax=Xylaria bambusicola TaxID=326684 RepID=A0AAN7UPK9_9PEZI